MREIKFRMWDFENGQMIDGDSLAFEEYAPLKHLLSQKGIMEYTGLQDKNGKEIYEGDIIRINHPYRGRSYIGPIVYNGYSFTAKDFYFAHHDNPSDPFESLEYLEVIGNIYENPELIEVIA